MSAEQPISGYDLADAAWDVKHGGISPSRAERVVATALSLHAQIADLRAERSSLLALLRPHLIHEVSVLVAARMPQMPQPSWITRGWWIENVAQSLRDRTEQTLTELGITVEQELLIAIEAQTLKLRDDLRSQVEGQ